MARDYDDNSGDREYSKRSENSIREIQEMEQIEKGLQDFLKQEMEKTVQVPEFMNAEYKVKNTGRYEENYYRDDENDGEEDYYEENDCKEDVKVRNRDIESYDDDWDSPDRRRTSQRTQSRGNGREAASGSREPNTKKSDRRTKRKKKKSGFRRFVAVLLIIVVIIAAVWYYIVGTVYSKVNYEKIDSVASESVKDDGVINILLIGNDSRENGEDGRSDAMILVSINQKSKKIYMTSLLRDIYVDIPGHDGNRLNAAYSFGGAELLMKTVEENFDIEVNRYVLVNFEAFANLVDAVGGVDLELSSAEVEYVNAYLWEYNVLTERPEGTDYMDTSLSGLIHLNGPQALAYSRNRYIGTDFGRTERQRKVLSAVIKKLPKAVLTNPKELVDGLLPNLTTNLTQVECYRLSFLAAGLLGYDIVQSSIPLDGTYKDATIRGMAVLEVDFDANKKYIQDNIYNDSAEVE